MQNDPFNLAEILEHAARFHPQVEIVTRMVEDDSIHRSNYAEAADRARQLANALDRLNVQVGDRVGTLGWNTQRHLEAWYAISGRGAVCHTINPRLFEEQLEYIINHAEDCILLVDLPFVPLLERLQEKLPSVEHYVVLTDDVHMPATGLKNAVAYESLIADESPAYDRRTLLYLRHYRQAQGGSIHSSIKSAARLCRKWSGCGRHRLFSDSADGCPDVSRQQLGAGLLLSDGGGKAGPAR